MRLFKTIIPCALTAVAGLIAESCAKPETDSTIEFVTRVDSVGYMIPDFFGDTVFTASKYSVVWPEKIGRTDFDALRDSLLNLTFGTDTPDSFDKATQQFMTTALDGLRDESDSTFTYKKVPYTEAYDNNRNNISIINSNVTLLTPDVLVVQVYNYEYRYGMAHGMQTERFLNYSIANHSLMTPENTFKPQNGTAILDLINAEARKRYPGEGTLFAEPIASFDNFQITEEEIVFVYQPYDVAPYSTGIVRVPVSQYDLYRFLTPEAIKALGLDN